MPVTTTLITRGDLGAVTGVVTRAAQDAGWSVTPAAAPRARSERLLTLERGSRLRSLLMGAGAGDRFHLRETVVLEEEPADDAAPGGPRTRVSYRTSGGASARLGGPYGAELELREHARTCEAIEQALRDAGLTVGRL